MAIKNAILVCHRCGTEFPSNPPKKEPPIANHEASLFDNDKLLDNEKKSPQEQQIPSSEQALILEQDQRTPPSITNIDQTQEHISIPPTEHNMPPKRKQAHIWYWFIPVLLCIGVLGLWQNQQQWLAQPWVRSLMMNMQLSIAPNAADWSILKKGIHSQWVDRQDHSRILFIDGYIQNRLLSDQLPPAIQIDFFDMPNGHAIQSRRLAITEPPSLPSVRHAPYTPPAIDLVPVSAGGQRAFALVIEDVPEQAREVAITIHTDETNLHN